MALCLAAAISQAPGLRGIPDAGQSSSAAISASCARSSATDRSRTMRIRLAMRRGDAIRQMASTARCVSVAVTATDHIIRSAADASRRLLLLELLAELSVAIHRLARGEVLQLEHLPELDLAIVERHPASPLERFVARLHLDHPVAGDELLGLGERTVDHRRLAAGETHA